MTANTPRERAQSLINAAVFASQQGNLEDAVRYLNDAITVDATWAEPRERLVVVLMHQDRVAEAIGVAFSCLTLRPIATTSINLLGQLLQQYPVRRADGVKDDDLIAALRVENVGLQPLAKLVFSQFPSRDEIRELLNIGKGGDWDQAADRFLEQLDQKRTMVELIELALRRGINTEPEIELLLTAIRRHLLLTVSKDRLGDPNVEIFVAALLAQCVNNEYVFYVDPEEQVALDKMSEKWVHDFNAVDANEIILMSLYAPIFRSVSDIPMTADDVTHRKSLALFDKFRREHQEEVDRAREIPTLGHIDDTVSRAVASQYEENPYPTWLDVGHIEPGALREQIASLLGANAALPGADATILIAGCGTGRQVVTAARGLSPYRDITAIDLSRTSLGYAARKSAQYDIKNLTFINMDILDLDQLDREFDFVACTGVLHHMADPLLGWETLARRIKPGGFAQIALYSAPARSHIETMPLTDEDASSADTIIRAHRHERLVGTAGTDPMKGPMPEDFSTLSGCRDLLFHVQETRFTIPEIKAALDRLKLSFLGFNLRPGTIAKFAREHPDPEDQKNLNLWWAFEQKYPETFGDMYNFWTQKLT